MCTVLLPPCVNPIPVNKHIISYHISYHIVSYHIMSHSVAVFWQVQISTREQSGLPQHFTNDVCNAH